MYSLAILLFIVMDPFGNLITVNTILSKMPPGQRMKVVLRESAIAALILLICVFVGEGLLGVLGLQKHSLTISGGIVLFLIALGMLFPSRRPIEESWDDSPFVVPIAMPLIAGPSAISMVILFSQENSSSSVAGAVLLASVASALVLAASARLFGYLGKRGSLALERLMGMLLIMISVQMMLDGFDAYLAAG